MQICAGGFGAVLEHRAQRAGSGRRCNTAGGSVGLVAMIL